MKTLTRCLASLCLVLLAGSARADDAPPMDRFTQIRLLTDNDEAWRAKSELIASARSSLDLAYFIVEDDASTQALLKGLVAASRRQPAVQVRLLVDWFQTYRQTAMLQALAANPGIEVRRRGAPSEGLRKALQEAGVDGPRFIAGLTTFNPRLVMASLARSTLFPPAVAGALADMRQLPAEALGPSAVRLLPALVPTGPGRAEPLPQVQQLVGELNQFMHWTHHKLLLADGRCFIMGGRNLSDAYHRNVPAQARPFQDTDVHACDGSGASGAQRTAFDALWAAGVDVRQSDPLVMDEVPVADAKAAAPAAVPAAERLRANAFVRVREKLPGELQGYLVNNLPAPAGDPAAITRAYVERIRALTARGQGGVIDIVNAYLFPSDESAGLAELRGSLLAAARAGITVNIRTNSLASTDLQPVNQAAYQTLGALIQGGVQVFELKPGFGSLHTKAAAIGDEWLMVGSYNMDPRSELYDSNNLLVLRDPSGRTTGAFRKARVACDCWERLSAETLADWQRKTQEGARMWQAVQRLL